MTAITKREEFPVSDVDSKRELLKNTIARDLSNDEFELFCLVCRRTGLDPFMKQIYPVKRRDNKAGISVMTIQTSIDGFRAIAERTCHYAPGREATYTYNNEKELVSATSYIKKMTPDGTWHEVAATAFYDEYVQEFKDRDTGKMVATQFWNRMPHVMLAKCAEALALRKAFPAIFSKIYSEEEMEQAANPSVETVDVKRELIGQIIPIIGRDESRKQLILGHYKVTELNQMTVEQLQHCLSKLNSKKDKEETDENS